MHTFRLALGIGLLVATVAQAAPERVVLHHALTPDEYQAERARLIDPLQFRALPKCRTGALPCRLLVRSGSPRLYRAATLADGGCDVTVIFPPPTTGDGRFKIRDGCKVAVSKVRSLAMPPDLFTPKPQVTISFPDLGDALGGLDTEVQLARGFERQQYRWVRAATKKNLSQDKVTRNVRGAAFTERWRSVWPEPRVFLDQFIEQTTVGDGYNVFFPPYVVYGYRNAPPGSPGCVAINFDCDIYTNQYPIQSRAIVGWRRKTDGGRDHWSDAIAVMGIRNGYSFGCAFGGNLPAGTSGNCVTRAATVANSTSPVF